jgi:hypothetical protein
MIPLRGAVGFLIVLLIPALAAAQRAAVPDLGPTGTVTGHITFAETQLPARFAEVVLVRQPDPGDPVTQEQRMAQQRAEAAHPSPAKKGPQKVVSVSGRSGVDGSFAITQVPPGDYWALGQMAGYLPPVPTPPNEKEADNLAKLTAELPVVHVAANQLANVNLVLRRGAVISGRVTFKDGTPLSGVQVTANPRGTERMRFQIAYVPLTSALQMASHNRAGGFDETASGTDDLGQFRIAGLTPGNYRVSFTLSTGGGTRMVQNSPGGFSGAPTEREPSAVTVFAPGRFRLSEARVFEIHADEQINDADVEVDLDDLRDVSGHVLAKQDRHPIGEAMITLSEGADRENPRSKNVEADGSFHFTYVPAGSYTLSVKYAADIDGAAIEKMQAAAEEQMASGIGMVQSGEEWMKPLHRYHKAELPVVVGEHDVVLDDILLDELKGQALEEEDGPP